MHSEHRVVMDARSHGQQGEAGSGFIYSGTRLTVVVQSRFPPVRHCLKVRQHEPARKSTGCDLESMSREELGTKILMPIVL